jgi:hypothetical protein
MLQIHVEMCGTVVAELAALIIDQRPPQHCRASRHHALARNDTACSNEHRPVYFNTFEQADGSKKVLLTS